MLKDEVRTLAYRRAIVNNRHLFQDKIVLDVGCGTGILCMFAAQAGAKMVIGVDNSEMLPIAQKIINANNFSNTVTLIKGKVEEVELPVPKVDIIISEWMGYFMLYEGMLDTVLFARDKWLAPGGIILPDKASLYITAIEDADYKEEKIEYWNNVYGFDMSCIREIAIFEPLVDVVQPKMIVTNDACILKIDIMDITKEQLPFRSNFKLKATRDDLIHAFVVYFDIEFTKGNKTVFFSTGPRAKYTHWKQSILYIDDVLKIQQGEELTGTIDVSPFDRNQRDLKIKLSYNFDGEQMKSNESVPTVGSSAILILEGKSPQFFLIASQTINLNSLTIYGGSLTISSKDNNDITFNVTSEISLVNSELEISVPSTIGEISSIDTTFSFQNSDIQVTGDINIDKNSYIFINNSIFQSNGDNIEFKTMINCFNQNTLRFLGDNIIFSGGLSCLQSSVYVKNPTIKNKGVRAKSIYVDESMQVIESYVNIGQGGLLTSPDSVITIADNAAIYVIGPSTVYNVEAVQGTLSFINSTNLLLGSVNGKGGISDNYFTIYIDNCANSTFGSNDSPVINQYTSLYVLGVTDLTLLGVHNITLGFSHVASSSESTLQESIQIDIKNQTFVQGWSSQFNAKLNVLENAQLSIFGGFNSVNGSGLIVNQNATVSLISQITLNNYQFGGITLLEGSTLNSSYSNITGDISATGSIINSAVTLIDGDVNLLGGTILNVNLESDTIYTYFKSSSFNSNGSDININTQHTVYFLYHQMVIQTNDAKLSQTNISVYFNGLGSSHYKGQSIMLWNSQSKITGKYNTKVLDSNNNGEFKALYYKLENNGYKIVIRMGTTGLSPFKIGLIVAGCVFGLVLIAILTVFLYKRYRNRQSSYYSLTI
eukprot:gene1456-1835_t